MARRLTLFIAGITLLVVAGIAPGVWAQVTPTPHPVESEVVPLPDTATPAPSVLPPTPQPLTPTPGPDDPIISAGVMVNGIPVWSTGLEVRGADQPWRVFRADLDGEFGVPLGSGSAVEGVDEALITFGGQVVLAIDAAAWTVEFMESGLAVSAETDLYLALLAVHDWPLVVRVTVPEADFSLIGAQGWVAIGEGGAAIGLMGGVLDIVRPVEQRFDRALDGETVMLISMAAGGWSAVVGEADQFLNELPVVPDTLRVSTSDLVPDAAVWHFHLDLDGDPATGLQTGARPGTDLVITLQRESGDTLTGEAYLVTSGVLDGEPLVIRVAEVPVGDVVEEPPGLFDLEIALPDLRRILDDLTDPVTGEPLAVPFSFERLRWHVTALDGDQVLAEFPSPGTVYQPAAIPEPAPPSIIPTALPVCTSFTLNPANLRARPGTDAPIISGTAAGDPVEIVGISLDGAWYVLRLADGRRAWIADFLLGAITCPAGYVLPVGE